MVRTGPVQAYTHTPVLMVSPIQAIAKQIALVAVQTLIPMAFCFLIYAAFPLAFSAWILPAAAIGLVTTTSFLFAERIQNRSSGAVSNPPIPGIKRENRNCWINSLARFLRYHNAFNQWLKIKDPKLSSWNKFNRRFDRSVERGDRVVQADSQTLRDHIASISSIPADSSNEADPAEALNALFGLMPDELKVSFRRQRIYDLVQRDPVFENHDGFLSVEITGENPSIGSLLRHFFSAQNHDPKNGLGEILQPSGRREAVLVREEGQFVNPPHSLAIQLKRFKYEKGARVPAGKISEPVKIHDSLILPTVEGGKVQYQLKSFIHHSGSALKGGHFIHYEEVDGSWYECNDSNVRAITRAELHEAKKGAYMIHYSKMQVRSASS